MKSFRHALAALAALALLALPNMADAQTANGKVTTAAPTYTNNTAAPLSLDTAGNLRINCITGCAGGGGGQVQGDVANGSPDTGNPVKIGGRATSSTQPLVSDGNRVNQSYGIQGAALIAGQQAASGDGSSNATQVSIAVPNNSQGSMLRVAPTVFNGTTWDRMRGDVNGIWISALPALPAGSNAIGTVGVTALPALPAGANAIGTVGVTALPALPAGTNAIGTVTAVAATSAGTSNFSAILANTTNSTLVKASAGSIQEISVYNTSDTIAWLKLYNASSAPTCGSGAPVGRYMIPGSASGGAGSNVNISLGKEFTTGISYCVTTGIADADTGAVAAATYTVNFSYR